MSCLIFCHYNEQAFSYKIQLQIEFARGNIQILTGILKSMPEMRAYIFGPLSDENSQWNISTCVLLCIVCVLLRKAWMESFVYKLLAP